MNIVHKIRDDAYFLVSILVAYALTVSATSLGMSALWLSLIFLIVASFYFSFTTFRSPQDLFKLLYFLMMNLLVIGYFALVYKSFGIIDTSSGLEVRGEWLNSIYFSAVTWTTLGYGDYVPTEITKPWIIAEALLGYLFMGLLVGKIVFLAQSGQSKSTI